MLTVTPAANAEDIIPAPVPFCITIVSDVGGVPVTAVMMPPPITPPELIMDCTLDAISEPSDCKVASMITIMPLPIALILVPLNTVEELVINVKD